MGKPVGSDVKRVEITALNTKINKEMFKEFKDYCAYLGFPMNVVLETFMQQYLNKRLDIKENDILKWENDKSDTDNFSTTFNKEICLNFKSVCKRDGYYIKHVITAFMEMFVSRNYILEFVNVAETEEKVNKIRG